LLFHIGNTSKPIGNVKPTGPKRNGTEPKRNGTIPMGPMGLNGKKFIPEMMLMKLMHKKII